MKKIIKFLFTGMMLIPSNGVASYNAKGAEVNVTISASMVGKFVATTNNLSIKDDKDNIIICVETGSLTTKNPLRDDHMRQDLGVDTYPVATLTVSKKEIKMKNGKVQGMLHLHGKDRPVVVSYWSEGDSVKHITGKMQIKITDWDVPARKYLGFGVKDFVDIEVKFDAELLK